MATLDISKDLRLPADAVTQTFAILAKRGMGKTYAAGVLVEEMAELDAQVVVIDPTDVWWGLKSSADGKGAGYPFVIFGGNHADVPLMPEAGKLLADFVVDSGHSCIVSPRLLSKTKQKSLIADFFERLYDRKGEKGQQSPLHVVIDEADAFVPQTYTGDAARCVGSIDDVVRRGRSSGLGVTLVSQRAAKVNKDVLSQAEVLIAMQTGGAHDRKALKEWIEANADTEKMAEFIANLVKLQQGEAWVWSPSWLKVLTQIKFRAKRTFDSSRTPKAGEKRLVPRKVADVDLTQLEQQMKESIDKAKANDPKELKKRIAELEREQKTQKPAATVVDESKTQRAVLAAIAERDRHWKPQIAELQRERKKLVAKLRRVHTESDLNEMELLPETLPEPPALKTAHVPTRVPQAVVARKKSDTAGYFDAIRNRNLDGDVRIGGGCLRMIQTLADRHPMKLTEAQWATQSKLKKSGGTWGDYKSKLRTAGLLEEGGGLFWASDAAVDQYGDPSRAPQTPDEVIASWKQKVGGGPSRMIDAIVRVYPEWMTYDELGEAVGVSPSGGTFGDYLSKLRSNGLVETQSRAVRATEALMEV